MKPEIGGTSGRCCGFPAKFGFDLEEWPGDEPGPNQVFTVMAQAFHWDTTQLEWFLKSKDILWAFSKGGKAPSDGRYYHEHIARKTEVIGMLPLRLIPDFRNLGTHHLSGADLLGKALFTRDEARSTSYSGNAPKGFDWTKRAIILEIFSRGSANDTLIAFNDHNRFSVFFVHRIHIRLLIGKAK